MLFDLSPQGVKKEGVLCTTSSIPFTILTQRPCSWLPTSGWVTGVARTLRGYLGQTRRGYLEKTLGVLDLLSEDLGKPREEVVALLYRTRDEARGRVLQNVLGSPAGKQVEELFRLLGRFSWESFVLARLPLFSLLEELKEALHETLSQIPDPWAHDRRYPLGRVKVYG